MKKKFKTKVSYFGSGYYKVSYIEYYLFPIFWKDINFWFSQTLTSGTECWSTKLFKDVKDAEKLAQSLKSIDDVNKYYEPMIEKMNQFYKDRENYYKNNVPYQSKTFH